MNRPRLVQRLGSAAESVYVSGIRHQELFCLFRHGLQVWLLGLPPDIYAAFHDNTNEANELLLWLQVSDETVSRFRQVLRGLKSRSQFRGTVETSDRLSGLLSESHTIAERLLDPAMGEVRQELFSLEPAAHLDNIRYSLGLCTSSIAGYARLLLVAPRLSSTGPSAEVGTTYLRELRQSVAMTQQYLAQKDVSEVLNDLLPRHTAVLRKIAQLVFSERSVPEHAGQNILLLTDTLFASIAHRTPLQGVCAELERMYCSGKAPA